MTGHLLDSLDSGNINTRILNTGNTIQDISGRVVYASTTGTIASPKLLDINNSGDLAAQFGDNINKITGLLDVNTGVGGNPQGTYGSEGQSLVVNQHENGVVWSGVTAGGSTTTFLNLTDTSNLANYSTVNQQLLAVSGSKIGFTGSGHFLDTTNSGHLNTRFITTGQTLNIALISSGQSHIDNVASTGDTLYANSVTTGETLRALIATNT